MIPGSNQIIACSECGGLAKYGTLLSGNTIGARIWTDGKRVAPMLPQPPAVVRCAHCRQCYWLVDAEAVGEMDPGETAATTAEEAWASAESVQEPTEEEYYRALRGGLAKDAREERDLRVLAWWRGNDHYRDTELPAPASEELSQEARENLEALTTLLEGDATPDSIMRAEGLRHLGRFDEAKALLLALDAPDYTRVIEQLVTLCEQGDTVVRELAVGG